MLLTLLHVAYAIFVNYTLYIINLLFINSFDKLQMHILDNITMTLKGNLLAISKLRTVCVYHRNCKNNKLRSMMTLNTMYYKVNTFFNEIEKVILICKLSNTII